MKGIEILEKYWGYTSFRPLQANIVADVINGHDCLALLPTGGGKSICFQVPGIAREGMTIVISPLIALMKNQVDAIRGISDNDGVAHVLNSSLNKTEVSKVMEDIRTGITKLLYVAPESLIKQEYVDFLKSQKISFVAIDEAHCISDWGHSFRPSYLYLPKIVRSLKPHSVLALTATATRKTASEIRKLFKIKTAQQFTSSHLRPNLEFKI